MKKSIATFAAAALLFAFASGLYAEKANPDVYDDGSETEEVSKDKKSKGKGDEKVSKIKWNTKANKLEAMSGDPYNQKKLNANRSFGDRLMNTNKFTKVEAFSVYLKPTIGKMFVRKGNLIYREGTDIGGFEVYYDSSAYALQFAQADRAIVIAAIDQYFSDFDEKRLDKKAKAANTKKVYGFSNGYEDFGIASGMMTNYCRPKIFYGYVFDNKSPYFTINVKKSQNLAFGADQTEEAMLKKNVIEQTYYLTKAQASKLKAFLSDQNIGGMQAATTVPETFEAADDYVEADAKE